MFFVVRLFLRAVLACANPLAPCPPSFRKLKYPGLLLLLLQMMPSPSTGNLTIYNRGGGGADPSSVEEGVPAEKEQLRRNLSLLKKKMHSQAGSRRSQVRQSYKRAVVQHSHVCSNGGLPTLS